MKEYIIYEWHERGEAAVNYKFPPDYVQYVFCDKETLEQSMQVLYNGTIVRPGNVQFSIFELLEKHEIGDAIWWETVTMTKKEIFELLL